MSRLPAFRILPILLVSAMASAPSGVDETEYRLEARKRILTGGLIRNDRAPRPGGISLSRQHDYRGPNYRGDGHDEERILKAQAKRERKALKRLAGR